MDVGLIQKAERQMMMDGKSASEIDAMKSVYRKQVFNPQGYSQAAGLGSFASGGEAYGPPPVKGPDPRGIGENIRMADGGEVMNGIGTLNETARNMTRGPRGIGAYQQFADGGEGVRPQSRPPEIRPQSRPPEIEEMAEIRNYLGSFSDESTNAPLGLRPRSRPEKYFEINSYDINGETQNAIDFKDGMRMFMPDVENMITSNRSATEPMVGRETGQEVLDFLEKNNPTSEEFIDYFSSARLADGGEVPRQTMIQNQPHMLAYINPEEEQMLRENGGAGLPGPGGVPAYWNLFEPSTWKGGENYTPGAGFEGFTSGPSKLAVATSLRPQSRPEEFKSQPINPNSQTDGNGNLVNPVVAPPVVAPQGITSLEDTGSRQSALKGSGILDGIGSFINNLPTTKIFKGIAKDVTMGFRAGLGNRESQIKRLREHADEDGKSTYTPSQVDDYFSATDSSLARLREQQARNQDNNRDEVTGISQTCPPGFVFDAALAQCVPITVEDDGTTSGLPPAPEYISSSFVPNTQMFADGGPVYMSNGGIGSIRPKSRPQDFKVDERVEEKNEARASLMETIYDLESNSDYNKWNLEAKNKPKTPLTSMTVREIMNYQKDDDGPAAGAGQIKHDTLEYLIDNGYISSSDVFSPEVQDKAVIRLLDRRGFVSWFNGETPTEEFGSDMAKEFASLPLLEARVVKGKARDRGQSRYANNTALMGADSWQDVLESSINIPQNSGKGESVPSYFLNEGIAPETSLRPIGRPLSIETPSYQEIRPQSRPESLYPAMDQGVEAALMEALQGQNLEEKYSVENMEQQLAAPQMRPQMRPESAPQMRPQMRPETLGIMSAIR